MARRGYSKRWSFFENGEVVLPPRRPSCFAARTGFSLMCRPAQSAIPTDFFSVGPFIFRGCSSRGLRHASPSMANFCHLLAKSANVSRSSEVEALFEKVAHTRAISKNFLVHCWGIDRAAVTASIKAPGDIYLRCDAALL